MKPVNTPSGTGCDQSDCLAQIREVLACEAEAIRLVSEKIQPSIVDAVELLFRCKGRVIVTGMGKMGWIARKAASTFNSTGTPAVFLHPGEAAHGDLGILTTGDVVLALSNSGETDEVVSLLPYMHRLNVPVIALSGEANSSLVRHSRVFIDTAVEQEADPISVAPTCSTTVALAMCDALAIALMHKRGFTREQFAIFHPGGHLGRKLLLTVKDLMHTGDEIPAIGATTLLREAIFSISKKGLGAALILNDQQSLIGIITDGDLRRSLQGNSNPLEDPVEKHMTRAPVTTSQTALAAEALRLMEDREITVLPVVDENLHVEGIIHLHDLVRNGLA
jgi:arabinose-5-phosphate isomerase